MRRILTLLYVASLGVAGLVGCASSKKQRKKNRRVELILVPDLSKVLKWAEK